jgi:hypothetical protein
MSNIRVSHDKSNPYVMINKASLEDKNLSWAAIGLLTYLLSKPDNWNVSVKHLIEIHPKKGGGRDSITKLLNELIENQYARREEVRENGRISHYNYVIYESKNASTDTFEPFPENQGTAHNEYGPFPEMPLTVNQGAAHIGSEKGLDLIDMTKSCNKILNMNEEVIRYRLRVQPGVASILLDDLKKALLAELCRPDEIESALKKFKEEEPILASANIINYIKSIIINQRKDNAKSKSASNRKNSLSGKISGITESFTNVPAQYR